MCNFNSHILLINRGAYADHKTVILRHPFSTRLLLDDVIVDLIKLDTSMIEHLREQFSISKLGSVRRKILRYANN